LDSSNPRGNASLLPEDDTRRVRERKRPGRDESIQRTWDLSMNP